jgi:hypothetical protein
VNIKSVDLIAKKYSNRGGAAGADYTDGVNNPREDWATKTTAAATTYAAGVQTAIGNRSYEKGVAAAGTEKWARKAKGVGAQRYAGGVQAAAPDYAKGVSRYLDVLRNINLPPRAPKGDPANNQRSLIVQQALRAAKVNG